MKSIKQCWAVLDFYEEFPVPILKNKLEQFQSWFQVIQTGTGGQLLVLVFKFILYIYIKDITDWFGCQVGAYWVNILKGKPF